jgi:hypothetical protein
MHHHDEARRPRRIRLPRRRLTRLVLVAGVAIAALAPAAWANHQFTDVPTASPHHDDISTIGRVGITGGCGPGLYCPTQTVQRDQMASFVARTLRALTPVYRTGTSGMAGTGALDLDASPVICQTGTFTPTVSTVVRLDAQVSLEAAASSLMGFSVNGAISTDGGTTWTPGPEWFGSLSSADLAGAWGHASSSLLILPATGQAVRFGVQVGRHGGTTDASNGRCRVTAQINYNDAGASTIGN